MRQLQVSERISKGRIFTEKNPKNQPKKKRIQG
jgi:hypothetical protein